MPTQHNAACLGDVRVGAGEDQRPPPHRQGDQGEHPSTATSLAARPGATLFPSTARHFTPELLGSLGEQGVCVVEVTHFIAARWQHGYLRE
ncbi:hypothetical protein ACFWWT_41760 [Streptomyces sp. NPDC058676]|uniref:hypothetical protein n=1 Tax=unclassified Streptomyces TaxID=2593676 RepID=UPI00365F9306